MICVSPSSEGEIVLDPALKYLSGSSSAVSSASCTEHVIIIESPIESSFRATEILPYSNSSKETKFAEKRTQVLPPRLQILP